MLVALGGAAAAIAAGVVGLASRAPTPAPAALAPIAAVEVPAPAAPAAPAVVAPPPAEAERAVEPSPAPDVVEAPEPDAPSPSPSPATKPAAVRVKVTLETSPACDVYLGKRKLGRSPVDVAVGAEAVALRLVSEADGINLDYALVPKRGEPTRRVEVPRAKLDLRVSPWAEVTIDGRALGVSPLPPTMMAGATGSTW